MPPRIQIGANIGGSNGDLTASAIARLRVRSALTLGGGIATFLLGSAHQMGAVLAAAATFASPKVGLTLPASIRLHGGDPDLLIHGRIDITDTSGHTVEIGGYAQIDMEAIYFNGVSDYLKIGENVDLSANNDFEMETGDLTVAFSVQRIRTGVRETLLDFRSQYFLRSAATIYIDVNDHLVLSVGGDFNIVSTTPILADGNFYHVAWTRKDWQGRLFLNGVQQGSTYIDTNNYLGTTSLAVGATVWPDAAREAEEGAFSMELREDGTSEMREV